jgi:type IV pilus assembly protein PilO
MDLNEIDLSEIDVSALGEWPIAVKAVIIVVICAIGAAGAYFGMISQQFEDLAKAKGQEVKLREDFDVKQAKAANLVNYQKQLKEMEETFGTLLRQLPDKTEVDALLVDVSQTGLAAGLKFDFFEPEKEVRREFYAELPIKLKVIGDYHSFGEFISGLAALPRIVTIHDINISGGGKRKGDDDLLSLEATARTYRYLEEGG